MMAGRMRKAITADSPPTIERALDEAAADYAGRMIDDGEVLDCFIEAHKEKRTLQEKVRDAIRAIVRKLTGVEKKQAQTAEGKLTAALEAATRQAETLQGESSDGTMGATRNSLKEDGRNERGKAGSGGLQKGSGREFGQTFNGERNKGTRSVRGELSAAAGRYGGVNPSFGQTPIRSWAEGHTVEPSEGSVAYAEQQTAVDYGVPSFVVADAVWAKNKGRAPAFAAGGQIYFRETLPEENRGMFAPHEITHVMRQTGYKPYLEFVERTPEMLNMSDPLTRQLLDHTAKHQGVDGTNADPTRLYDELNATIYGHYAANKMEGLHASLHQVFYDFDAYISELAELHERFKADNQRKTRFSLKAPVEETENLIALHNLTEEKLWGDLRLGGFPMPSIAVTRIDVPHTNFGDITLVMDKRSIDPKANRKNTVYSADAWTPTFPQVEYAADPAAERRISGRLRELSGKVDEMFRQDLYRITYDMEDLLNRYGGEDGLLRQVMDNYGLKAAYLEDAGHHVSAATVQREADKGYSQDRVEKYRAIVEALGTDDPDEIGHIPLKELRDRYGDELEAAFPGMTKSTFRLSNIIRQVQAYLQGQGGEPVYETVTDTAATRRGHAGDCHSKH